MAAILKAVATIDNLIIKPEKDCFLLKAKRFAIKKETFKTNNNL